jgi:hypothetical protein
VALLEKISQAFPNAWKENEIEATLYQIEFRAYIIQLKIKFFGIRKFVDTQNNEENLEMNTENYTKNQRNQIKTLPADF